MEKKKKSIKIQFGSLVRAIKINKSGVVVGKVGRMWLVTFPNGESKLFSSNELENNTPQ
jgi:hypothetical protein